MSTTTTRSGAVDDAAVERDTVALGRQLAALADGKAGVFRMSWWDERLMGVAMHNQQFKTELFRLVDVFPATTDGHDRLRHMSEYFSGGGAPAALAGALHLAARLPGGAHVASTVAQRSIARMARQFIAGTDATTVAVRAGELWTNGRAVTVDVLGEKTVSQEEADVYVGRVAELAVALARAAERWSPNDRLERDDRGAIPRVSISVKPTALSPHFSPLSATSGIEEVIERLTPVLRSAAERQVLVWLDMEHYDVKDVTLELFARLADQRGLEGLHLGLVLQAYLRDSITDLGAVIELSRERRSRGLPPLWVRLVKGAYWDAETVHARAEGWPEPVFARKADTDANYERATRVLHDHHDDVRAAFGSHNLRSLAHAVTYARHLGIPDHGYELQMLFGMAEPVHEAVCRSGLRLRVYAPMGELLPGMSYLVRRLLENTANESFVRLHYAEGKGLNELLAPPVPSATFLSGDAGARSSMPDGTSNGQGKQTALGAQAPAPYRHEPPAQLRHGPDRAAFGRAVEAQRQAPTTEVPVVIDGQRRLTGDVLDSVDPAHPSRVVARAAAATAAEADEAVAASRTAGARWAEEPASRRAQVLFDAGAWMRRRRFQLAALEVAEAGKPWPEADADVGEAIDFCEYYGRQMLDLERQARLDSPPGERNDLFYRAKGVAAVISPWNFPLAIPTGMVAAALIAGNGVVLKPAEQTPAVGFALVQAFEAAGLPPGVLNFLPGVGEVVGDALVRHPAVDLIAFTGSLAVGLAINATAAVHRPGQRSVRRVIAEMGGKNPVVVDTDADLDQAVPGIIYSAFGFAGQKCSACSRLIVVEAVADALIERLVAAATTLAVGDPADPGTEMGPLIDAEAQQRVRRYVDAAPGQGRVVLARTDVPDEGFFAGPCLVDGVDPQAPLAREEIFGPVLSVLRVPDFEAGLEVANATDFALTAGVFSRSPVHIREATRRLRAGNVYVNRHITGAIPGRHPFGGYGLSGVGFKAGGPHYLLQFLDQRAVSENTMRQGFTPDSP